MAARVKALRRLLARDLIRAAPGERLPPIRALAAGYGASVGATQIALAGLAAEGVIELDSRPRRGALLIGRDLGRLSQAAEVGPLLVCLSLPSTERINALATAIKSSLVSAGVEGYLVFTRGSHARLSALRQGRNHLAVVSALAAEALRPPDLETILVLPRQTFVHEHRVYYRAAYPVGPRRMRVAIDPSSLDFDRLTVMEFGQEDVDLVPLNYLTTMRAMEAGSIDAVILDDEDSLMRVPPDVRSRPLSPGVLTALDGSNTRAAFVARSDDAVVLALARACLDATVLVQVQNDVISGRRPPEY